MIANHMNPLDKRNQDNYTISKLEIWCGFQKITMAHTNSVIQRSMHHCCADIGLFHGIENAHEMFQGVEMF